MGLAARNAAETLAREQARWLADQGKTLAALEELAAALGCRSPRSASSATTSATSRARSRSEAWSCSRTAGREPASTAGSGSGRSRARTTSPATRKSCGGGSAPPSRARRGARRNAAGRCPIWSSSMAASRQVNAAKQVLDELGLHDLPLAGLAKEREELFLPGRSDPVVLPADVVGAVPGPATARRGAPFRDHLPPHAARPADGPVGVRRPARCRPEAQARAAQGVRVDQAGPRGAGRADRGGARHQPCARRADQGDAGGLSSPAGRLTAPRGAFRVASRRYAQSRPHPHRPHRRPRPHHQLPSRPAAA